MRRRIPPHGNSGQAVRGAPVVLGLLDPFARSGDEIPFHEAFAQGLAAQKHQAGVLADADPSGHRARREDRHLAARGIFAWSGNFYAQPLSEALGLEPDGALRVGLLHYNTAGEVDRLLAALDELVGG